MSDQTTVILVAGTFQVRGTSAYTLRLAHGLPAHGYQPLIVCPDASHVPESAASLHIRQYDLLDIRLLQRVITRFVASDLSESQPALVHVQSRHAIPFGSLLAHRLNVPLLVTVHDYVSGPGRLTLDSRNLQRVIAVSESVSADLINRGAAAEHQLSVIHSGVEVPDMVDNASLLNGRRVPVVGTAGPLEASKGLNFFLNAARQVLDAGHDVEFLIAGSGPEEHRLRRMARELKLTPQVTFVPNLMDFEATLRAMDIFCLPSVVQGLGTVMLEAMALGRPVIASEVGGVSSILTNGETGLTVPHSNSDRLAKRIIELLNDPIRARVIGNAANRRVRDAFDVTRMIAATADEYQAVLSALRQPESAAS